MNEKRFNLIMDRLDTAEQIVRKSEVIQSQFAGSRLKFTNKIALKHNLKFIDISRDAIIITFISSNM